MVADPHGGLCIPGYTVGLIEVKIRRANAEAMAVAPKPMKLPNGCESGLGL